MRYDRQQTSWQGRPAGKVRLLFPRPSSHTLGVSMNMYKSAVSVVVLASLLTACAQVPSPQQANDEGNVAYYSQRYDDALARFGHALAVAEKNGDQQYVAIAMFGLARTYAQLCQESDAEKWFNASIAAREALPDTPHAYITQNLLEYGRFLASWSRQSEALSLYDRAMPLLESLGLEEGDPLGYVFVLDEYAALLTSAGRTGDASAANARAKMLRETYKGRKAEFTPEPYPDCNQGT